MEQINPEEIFNSLKEYALQTGPIEWAAAAGLFIILLIAISMMSGKRRRKKKAKTVAPRLSLQGFQVSPMGRDAYLKVLNNGQLAHITDLSIKGRRDISVKNEVAGHQMPSGESYRILLESVGAEKLSNNFTIELTYMDQLGNVYQQNFPMKQQIAKPAKLIRLA
ncbi:MAG: hypothetical protein MI974_16200 [Chitinophagales bacterium]|nr:hypothetical protein [Chitinophagales bacterium]